MDELTTICAELKQLQHNRAWCIKARLIVENNRRANIANLLGYNTGLDESSRKKAFEAADQHIKKVLAGQLKSPAAGIIRAIQSGIIALTEQQKGVARKKGVPRQPGIEDRMLHLIRQTPAAAWVNEPEQSGFGELMLAVVIGETGDLRNYSNPGKVWARLGCAPFQKGDKTQMGATWRSKGGLTAEDWTAFGYSPRRRSIAYLIGEGLKRQNKLKIASGGETARETDVAFATAGNDTTGGGDDSVETEDSYAVPGPYRRRYDEAKTAIQAKHPDYPKSRCDRHGMLLATKLLLKNLWLVWNPTLVRAQPWSESLSGI